LLRRTTTAALMLVTASIASAGTATGVVTGYVPFNDATTAIFLFRVDSLSGAPPCNTSARFAISDSDPKYKETVAAVMSAYATGASVYAVGHGTCNTWSNSEDLYYFCVGTISC
jgi:hypothetical protein